MLHFSKWRGWFNNKAMHAWGSLNKRQESGLSECLIWISHFKEPYYFSPWQTEPCGVFLFVFSVQRSLRRFFLQFLFIDKMNHALCKGWKHRPRQCRDGKTQSVSFPLQRFRDGRDYGRITLHNMAAPNQIKAKTIKARVKATAVSSFKCLCTPAPTVTLESTVSIPNLCTSGTGISPVCMNAGQRVVRT